MNILFLYLKAFSSTGGIEKYNKLFIKALSELHSKRTEKLFIKSLYDESPDEKYIDKNYFLSSFGSKIKFFVKSILKAIKSDLVIVSHINLSIIVIIIKFLYPNKKVCVLTYGIDVWDKPTFLKKTAMKFADKIFTISKYTKDKITNLYNISEQKIDIIPCALDPYFTEYADDADPNNLPALLRSLKGKRMLLTVSRLNKTEKFKGYDNVISALPKVINEIPDLLYLIVGKGDDFELSRINNLVSKLNLQDHVLLAGYVSEEQLPFYYQNADVFIMTSKKEGFGIVYLESLYCGTPVIAGNKDGSYDTLLAGKLGFLVDPEDIEGISDMIVKVLNKNVDQQLINPEYLKNEVYAQYSYDRFKSNLTRGLRNFGFRH